MKMEEAENAKSLKPKGPSSRRRPKSKNRSKGKVVETRQRALRTKVDISGRKTSAQRRCTGIIEGNLLEKLRIRASSQSSRRRSGDRRCTGIVAGSLREKQVIFKGGQLPLMLRNRLKEQHKKHYMMWGQYTKPAVITELYDHEKAAPYYHDKTTGNVSYSKVSSPCL